MGLTKLIRCDNGPEFISKTFTNWCKKNFIEIKYTQQGKPMQNGYIEWFISSLEKIYYLTSKDKQQLERGL